jgi:hypothetical protein
MAINQNDSIIGYTYFNSSGAHKIKTLAYADDICTILHNYDSYKS